MSRTNDYGLEPPTEREAIEALADLVGAQTAQGIWSNSARTLGIKPPVTHPDDLRAMADHLMHIGGLMRIAGRSTKVRVTTYEALTRPARR